MSRIAEHPILGPLKPSGREVSILVDGEEVIAYEGEMIAAALMASGRRVFRYTEKRREPRGLYCAIGRCTDCVMIVNGIPNVRTCVTPVEPGMIIETQRGIGRWGGGDHGIH
ncbi:MAG: (2Fe-2S)-binding protein [Spirochaetes bacterium]|nr:MAG: (2Fe-2S)-binding protein [Spirochaetota bacterium]